MASEDTRKVLLKIQHRHLPSAAASGEIRRVPTTHDDQDSVSLHCHRQVPPKLLGEEFGRNATSGKAVMYHVIRLITRTQQSTGRSDSRRTVLDRLCAVVQDETGWSSQSKVMVGGVIHGRIDLYGDQIGFDSSRGLLSLDSPVTCTETPSIIRACAEIPTPKPLTNEVSSSQFAIICVHLSRTIPLT